MSPWQQLPLATDPTAVIADILARLVATLNPGRDPGGWSPREGALEVAIAEEFAAAAARVNAAVVAAADSYTAGVGVSTFRLAPILGQAATLPATATTTGAGSVIPAGFTVVATTDDGDEVAYVLPAQETTAAAEHPVTLVARDVGAFANGVPPGPLQLVDASASVVAVTATAESSGGVDTETQERYLDRLVDYVQVLRPGAVRATDAAILARNTPGVQRALAVDLYDAQTNTANAERTVSVYPVDADGAPVPAATATALRTALEAVREVNFVFRVAAPTYTKVAVTFSAVADLGYDPEVVDANVVAAVTAYLSPARWGGGRNLPSGEVPTSWEAQGTVRVLDLVRVAANADGVAHVEDLLLNGVFGDVALAGRAALPAPVGTGPNNSTISGTVV